MCCTHRIWRQEVDLKLRLLVLRIRPHKACSDPVQRANDQHIHQRLAMACCSMREQGTHAQAYHFDGADLLVGVAYIQTAALQSVVTGFRHPRRGKASHC